MTLSLLAVVTGHPAAVEGRALSLVETLAEQVEADSGLEGVVVVDDPEWLKVLPMSALRRLTVRVGDDQARDRPGALFNTALEASTGDLLTFAWPGVDLFETLPALHRLTVKASEDAAPFYARARGPSETRASNAESWLAGDGDGLPAAFPVGWLQLADLVPMHCCVINPDFARWIAFSEAPELQAGFWWDFCLRAARRVELKCDGQPAPEALSWWRYPFRATTYGTGDRTARVLMDRSARAPALPPANADAPAPAPQPAWLNGRALSCPWDRPLTVTLLGGVNEPAHNQLCFFNYFERLRDLGWLSWRTVLDTAAHELDVLNADLVIFSRVKTAEGVRLMDLCVRRGVPTLYMIDDNWFRVGQDVPAYREMFATESPFTQAFLHCVDRADLTLTYSAILEDDLKPHARAVARIETNIDLSLFPARDAGRPSARVRLGYVGSARTDSVALDALCDVVEEREDTELFFMSGQTPDSVLRVPESRRQTHPYVFDYARYAETVSAAAPDVLIAPLGDTMFEQSKCPNKYLEITAAGAAGLYSDNGLYRRYVRQGENGWLNGAHTRRGWREAIERVLAMSAAERAAVVFRARADVEANFSTEARLADFVGVLARTLELAAKRRPRSAS